ncbi:MAG: GTPase domain-containing protein [Clostridia bacterium]|nr:GTPase domain-containing protein [Clostridia bacterium]
MSFVCPYCLKPFERDEVLFYKDSAARNPIRRLSAEDQGADSSAVAASHQDESEQRSSDFASVAGRRRPGAATRFRQEEVQTAENQPQETESGSATGKTPAVSHLDLGITIQDTILERNMAKYGGGRIFTCKRTTVFYGIKPRRELEDHPTVGYGYIEDPEAAGIPDRLRIYTPAADGTPGWSWAVYPICPNCRCDLPTDYFSVPEENIHVLALAGCTAAGKTQYITVALEDLVKRQADNLELVVSCELELCSKWFHQINLENFEKTRIDATDINVELFPLLLKVRTLNGETHFVMFYDCAGEYAVNKDYAVSIAKFQRADTILLMVDSAQLFHKDLNEGELISPLGYMNAVRALVNNKILEGQKLKHVIVALTKCDVLMGKEEEGQDNNFIFHKYIPGTSIETGFYESSLKCHRGAFQYGLVVQNGQQINEVLADADINDIQQAIAKQLGEQMDYTFDLLAVSTYSRQSDGAFIKTQTIEGSKFHRLVEPILVAMYHWYMLPGEDGQIPVKPSKIQEPPPKLSFFQRLFGKKQ